MKVIERVSDARSLRGFKVGVILAIAGALGSFVTGSSVPLCLGLAGYFVASWPLAKRFATVAFTGRYPK
ncbi:hypothetical protein PQH03_28980 [Ralstonia insidiosa]|jgi:hypothetical protein|uniref:Uncharacterized protein n=1 Tax=Ralstonia insidiosa TaxID=190721 RepID=A0A192A7R5_9RALS|nr:MULTISPECIES: hypothetical protein [Ralstonia]KMW47652.1 hypothetical protein AC240_08925 [Ralstonia sp. MD27]ANJ76424.1 hypothetical protein A9Y76_27910 [Ralstonia insidiosa]MBA9869724.1 hypothetical protein [Ralstonia insidiosa]MBA9913567.1 hypothetical protein [Ralstonia insidiosa]MBA9926825.1 hypothetical protein [Ralstonia pickettii]